MMAFPAFPGIGRLLARQHAHQGGFADAVRSDERDPLSPFHVQCEIVEDDEVAVGFPDILQLEHRAAALRADGKIEVDLLALRRHLDGDDLLEHLDPALTCEALVAW